jgi:hypothetical protein
MLSHLEARGVEPLFPTLSPARSRKSFIPEDSEKVGVMEMAGRSRMLLVLLLGGERLETPGISVLDSLFP